MNFIFIIILKNKNKLKKILANTEIHEKFYKTQEI